MKEINVEIYINWDNDGVTVKLSDDKHETVLGQAKVEHEPEHDIDD